MFRKEKMATVRKKNRLCIYISVCNFRITASERGAAVITVVGTARHATGLAALAGWLLSVHIDRARARSLSGRRTHSLTPVLFLRQQISFLYFIPQSLPASGRLPAINKSKQNLLPPPLQPTQPRAPLGLTNCIIVLQQRRLHGL